VKGAQRQLSKDEPPAL